MRKYINSFSDKMKLYHQATYDHCVRVARLSKMIGCVIGLTESELFYLFSTGMLHDLGKTIIPVSVLEKPFTLNAVERALMLQHPKRGAQMLNCLDHLIPQGVASHHEYWNGNGYPDRLRGESIPLYSRIIAIADAIDAMTEPRPYRTLYSFPRALKEVVDCAGLQFDPYIVHKIIPR
mgnify:CR=1 FL=1|jgi:putative nucleotidyltransferase with HDIG domain